MIVVLISADLRISRSVLAVCGLRQMWGERLQHSLGGPALVTPPCGVLRRAVVAAFLEICGCVSVRQRVSQSHTPVGLSGHTKRGVIFEKKALKVRHHRVQPS